MKKLELLDLDATPTLLYPVPSTLQPTQWLLSSRSCALLFDVRPAPFALLSRARPPGDSPPPVRPCVPSCPLAHCLLCFSLLYSYVGHFSPEIHILATYLQRLSGDLSGQLLHQLLLWVRDLHLPGLHGPHPGQGYCQRGGSRWLKSGIYRVTRKIWLLNREQVW